MKTAFFGRKKLIPLIIIFSLIFCFLTGISPVSAEDMESLKARQQQLSNEISANEKKLSELGDAQSETEEYLAIYDEKMHAQEALVESLNTQAAAYALQAEDYEKRIADTEVLIDEGIEAFRKRLRAMYMSQTSSLASVLTGSTSFYDILVSMEFIERVAKRDDDLINGLNEQIAGLDEEKAALSELQTELNNTIEIAELEKQRLYATYDKHAETLAANKALIDDYTARGSELEEQSKQVEADIEAFIIAEQKRLEEERLTREAEAERLRQEALKAGADYEKDTSKDYVSYSNTGFIWPVPSVHNTTDGYGNRWIVEEQQSDFHKGLDITKPGCKGAEIVASAGGTIIQAGNNNNGYGNCVIIDHGNNISTLYAHMSSTAVSVGAVVNQGDTIGYIGNTGNSYGYHCHFEVRVRGQHTDPLQYVSP
ncbi:MAG: peptidoglycan DD-metalloendopeptidase family protein [Ruminococcus sp.]|jgi:murein DD-endopeptidase MepM/ murein hydrolase activator NlpD|nr:peptidoglycan DD-metalloendopeptidase family protein [Ruminococcus sp.]